MNAQEIMNSMNQFGHAPMTQQELLEFMQAFPRKSFQRGTGGLTLGEAENPVPSRFGEKDTALLSECTQNFLHAQTYTKWGQFDSHDTVIVLMALVASHAANPEQHERIRDRMIFHSPA